MGIDLSTTYLGLRLSSPFMIGASPLADHLDAARRLEDAGCAALVLHSLFEEQITESASGRIGRLDPLDRRFSTVVSYFPEPGQYVHAPDAYLEHLRQLKQAVSIPVIGSLNGVTPESWLRFALLIEQAGADALELNVYKVATNPDTTALNVEVGLRQMVADLRSELRIPFAVKLAPFFTAFANVAQTLTRAGAAGLVLFNRFLQPDIDLDHMTVWPRLELSDSSELLVRLRWLSILRGQVPGSLAATGGVATPDDGIKAILAGADAVQLVSAILRHGPSHFAVMRDGLRRFMEANGFASVTPLRGALSLERTENPSAFERAQYIRTLSGWASLLEYQEYVRTHKRTRTS